MFLLLPNSDVFPLLPSGMRTILILASTTRRGRTRPTTGTDPQVRLAPQGVHRATIPRRVRPVPVTITGAATDTDDELSLFGSAEIYILFLKGNVH